MAYLPSAEQELWVHWVPCKQLRHHRGSRWKLSQSQRRGTSERIFTVSRKMNFLDTGHIFQASFMKAEDLPLSQEVGANQKHLWMWVHNKCTPQIKVNSCDAPERWWPTSVRKSVSTHQGIKRTVEELNEILIHFIHSLNRSGNYNLPNTRLRSGEKKTHP